MRGTGQGSDAALENLVRQASDNHDGPWPTVSIWHGTGDATVAIGNMDALGRQWRAIHDISGSAATIEQGTGWEHRSWSGTDGRVLVEEWSIAGMGHGVPLDTQSVDRVGQAGAFMLDAGIASTAIIARSWGLLDSSREASPSATAPQTSRRSPVTRTPLHAMPVQSPPAPGSTAGIQTVIEDALRAAGLMR